ncbi:MAG: sulfatase-like hydrolase/transferase [Verrucomicrobiales bacterium]
MKNPSPATRYAFLIFRRLTNIFSKCLFASCLIAGFAVAGAAESAAADTPPNILLVMTDDQGFGDISSHGNPWIETPNMDRVATEGARFDRFFVEPVCAPTRAALLSGRYPTRTGVHGVTRNLEVMRGEEVTIAELLRDEAGYATGCFGKWHNGAHWPHHPNAQGFDTFVGFCGGHWNEYFDPVLERDGEPFQARGFIADIVTDEAIAFMRLSAEKTEPFFCYVPFNTPHTPASVPDADWRRWRNASEPGDPFTRAMYALCENIDANLGRLLEALDSLGIAEDTVVLFLTDNGPNGKRFNDGMLGRKGSEMEGGVRVPLFVRWPGRIEPETVIESNAAHIDILPTLCAFAGVEDPDGETLPLDGVDLSSLLLGGGEGLPERYFYTWRNPDRWSIRSDRYRATRDTLHDLIEDPAQKNNLASAKPKQHRDLVAAYRAWEAEAVPASPLPEPVPVGHDEWPRVTVQAHEFEVRPGEGEGISYCEMRGYANQWIDRWTDVDAFAECPLRVAKAGRYRVTFRYACPPDAAGSRFRLEAGETSIEFEVEEPWISAVYPASEQVSQRAGGYLSRDAWKDIVVGEVDLEAGEFPLRLRALKKTGEAMPDFKAVVLERR